MYASTKHVSRRRLGLKDDRGVALITALALLVLFSMLGTAYLGYMLSDRKETRLELTWIRGRQGAEAGVYGAVGAIERQLSSGAVELSTATMKFPAYDANGETLEPRTDVWTEVTVSVTDENARININMAPRGVLEQILHVDRAVARTITSELPRSGEGTVARYGWFTNVSELVSRGYLTQEAFDALDTGLLTVYTGDDVANPVGYINLNSAPAEVVAAVLNVPLDRAQSIAQGPPLMTLAELSSAAGQDASAFNLISEPNASVDALPKELLAQSRTYRIISEARVASQGGEAKGTPESRVEAVVHFPLSGPPQIRYWSVGHIDEPEAQPLVADAPSVPDVKDTAGELPAPAETTPDAVEDAPAPESEGITPDPAQV